MKTSKILKAYLITSSVCMVLFLSSCRDAELDHSNIGHQILETKDFDSILNTLQIELKSPGTPIANYVHVAQSGNLLFLAGKGPTKSDGELIKGKVGIELSIEEGYEASRWVAINQLAVLKDHLGDLNRVKRVVKVLGMVNCSDDFTNHPEVINGFSDLMVEVFGEKGKHARSAVGMNSLPRDIAVEIEVIVEIFE
jgi:enamine deaminase RidA (YjgF/YER057c/UK114 family)